MSRVYVSSLINDKIKEIRSMKFCVVCDFDKTITTNNSDTTLGVMSRVLSREYKTIREQIMKDEKSILMDEQMAEEQKSNELNKLWLDKIAALRKFSKEEDLYKVLKEDFITLREGIKELIAFLDDRNAPLIVNSAGFKEIIQSKLISQECLKANLKIYANSIYSFDNTIINPLSKSSQSDFISEVNKYEAIILIGDILADSKMLDYSTVKHIIKIGFLDGDIQEQLEEFTNCFDIVITDNGDFKQILKGLINDELDWSE